MKREMSAESIEDFRAAFVCITNSPDGYFRSPEELTRALQGCGKNPNVKKIESIWRSYDRIDIETFCDLAREENSITETELLEAFRFIDINRNGYITTKDFIKLFTTSGDSITEDEARELVHEADLNKDGRINYGEFSKFIIDTIEKAKRVARKKMKKMIALRREEEEENEQQLQQRFHDRRSPREEMTRLRDDYDSMSISKPRRYSNQIYDSDLERPSKEIKRPGSNSSFRRNEPLARENSNDSLRSTSKLSKQHSSYRESDSEAAASERQRKIYRDDSHRDRHHHHHHHDRERSRDRAQKDTDRNQRQDRNYHENDFDRPIKKRDHYYDDLDRHHRDHRDNDFDSHDHDHDRDRVHHRDPYGERQSRSRSRDRRDHENEHNYNREHDFDKEFNFNENSSYKKKSPRSSKNISLFETKHKPIERVAETIQEPKNFRKWSTKTTKGAFYFNETINGIISNSFALDISVDTWCTRLDLSAGRYFLFPFTSGCHLKKRNLDYTTKAPKFYEKDLNNKRVLSRKFKDALSVIFDLCDLDSNGRLSQEELNMYTFLTANENLSGEEWQFVGETVGFEKNELTKDGFIKLSKIEAQRNDTDLEDIAMRLANLGFNNSLTIDQSCPYIINVSCEVNEFDLLIGEIYKLKAAEQFLSQIIEAKGEAKTVKEVDGLVAFEYHNNYVSFIQFLNESSNEIRLEVDCSLSENCLTNTPNYRNTIKVKPMKSKLAMCLTPKSFNKEWTCKSTAVILNDSAAPADDEPSNPRRKF